jgi:SAM-dependent methyltransferase
MTESHQLIIDKPSLDLSFLVRLQERPDPFSPGKNPFWDAPHISRGMLAAHLDPSIDLASRRPEIIERTIDWLMGVLNLEPGDAVLDLGCGPGLYALRLAQCGLKVTGVDISHRSIAYALETAKQQGLTISFRCENYLTLQDSNVYHAALLIFGDYCTFNPNQRQHILGNVRRALKPGGYFVLDVSTREHRKRYGAKNEWSALQAGFWRPEPHLVLTQGFDYPDEKIYLDQMIVVDEDGRVDVYRNWFQDFDGDMITSELNENGFDVLGLWGDLTGTHLSPDSEWIGVVAKPKDS